MSVLVLNADYRPHKVVSDRIGTVLCWEHKATMVEERTPQKLYRSPSISLVVPQVCALKKYVKRPDSVARVGVGLSGRRAILMRDNFICVYCGQRGTTIDHVIPTSRGGTGHWSNLVCSCQACNLSKGNKTLEELGWSLGYDPVSPEMHDILRGSLSQDVWERWVLPTLR